MDLEKTKYINNEIYDQLGTRWYEADDDPVALLRASAKHKIPWILKKIKETGLNRPKVLDVGCGVGFISNALAENGISVTGLDASNDSLRIAAQYDITKKVNYVFGDARKLPFEDGSFDVVTAMDFLEHVEEVELVINEFRRVLKPGGVFLFHTFNRNFLSWLIAIKMVEWFVPNTPKDMHVLKLFIKPTEIAQFCKRQGFEQVHIFGIRPKSILQILKGIFSRRVPKDFEFEFSNSQVISYAGSAIAKSNSQTLHS